MVNELIKRNVPDFFYRNGQPIKNLQDWESSRQYFKDLFLKEEYGPLPKKLEPSIKIEKDWVDFAGKAVWERVYFTFENEGKSHTVVTHLILPKGQKNIPVFLSLNFQKEVPNKYLPIEEIIDTGFGIFAFCTN